MTTAAAGLGGNPVLGSRPDQTAGTARDEADVCISSSGSGHTVGRSVRQTSMTSTGFMPTDS